VLVRVRDVDWFTQELVKHDRGLRYFRLAFEGRRDQHPPVHYFVDDPASPQTLLMWAGHQAVVVADGLALAAACRDLYHYRVGDDELFPSRTLRAEWEARGRRWLWLRTLGRAGYHAAVAAGFHIPAQEYTRRGMWLYWLEGAPRFAQLVRHSCRVVHGLELYELMRQGITYDENGGYTKLCLESGPSFVCEAGGQPVCWSCTHLNQQPGMIYTPPPLRRLGYARSLAAFQIDYMLARDGCTHAWVMEHNTPSKTMLESLGFNRLPWLAVTYNAYWRRLRAPLISCSPSPTPGSHSWHG
jgi:hypothetical protein